MSVDGSARFITIEVAVVTGAGRGIGRVCAATLVSAGTSVIINDLDAEPAAEAVACHAISPGSAVASIGSGDGLNTPMS